MIIYIYISMSITRSYISNGDRILGGVFMKCPICGNENTGRLSKSRYFCSNCFVEIFYSRKRELHLLKIAEDGSTLPISMAEIN